MTCPPISQVAGYNISSNGTTYATSVVVSCLGNGNFSTRVASIEIKCNNQGQWEPIIADCLGMFIYC